MIMANMATTIMMDTTTATTTATARANTSTKTVEARPDANDAKGRIEVIYDGACAFCTVQARRLAAQIGDRVALVPSSSPHVVADHALASRAANALVVRDDSGKEWVGADAVARLLQASPRLALLGHAMTLPGVRQVAHLGYRAVARIRHRLARWS
jgi:predicted DCC family thiol-disulfide oxidoreductase YuxK